MVWEGIQTAGFRDILGRLARWCPKEPLSQHFRICEAEYVLTDISVHLKLYVSHPHKTQTSVQNDHQTVRFCNGLGRDQNLERLAGWSPKMPVSQHFRVCETECV